MELVMTLLGVLSSVLMIGMTLFSVLFLRKPRKISLLGTLLSGVISLIALLVIVYLGGMRLNLLLAVPSLLLGMLLGFIRGQMVKFRLLGTQVIGQNSILLVILWGFSMGISLLLGLLNWPLMTSLGLIPVYFSTGLQLGYTGNHLLRRTAILLGAGQGKTGRAPALLNMEPGRPGQIHPMHTATGQRKTKPVWSMLVIVVVSVCLLLTALTLTGMVLWQNL